MADAQFHAKSSASKWGGDPEDYAAIHMFLDETKRDLPDNRHRALRHHSEGVDLCIKIFGPKVKLSNGKTVPVRWIAERHIKEDLGHIPTAADWLRCLELQPWMERNSAPLSKVIDL